MLYMGVLYIAIIVYTKTHNQDTCTHAVVRRAAQEALGAHANGSEYINRNNKVAIFTHS